MSKKDLIIELYSDTDDVMFADGLDEAIIGFDENNWKVVYSKHKVIGILISEGDMSEEEAMEYADYNIFSAYMGEKTPSWVEEFKWN